LIGAATKNDAKLVDEAFARADLLLPPEQIFPVEAHWGPKSPSIARILRAWNLGPEAVVFVDDSPLELDEVRAAFPAVRTLLFPAQDDAAVSIFLEELQDLFGRSLLFEEDRLRVASVRTKVAFHEAARDASLDSFLGGVGAELVIEDAKSPVDLRALELVNKTNQFNLNGRRHAEADWARELGAAETILRVGSYSDKYGPLGKVVVARGRRSGPTLRLDVLVLSCRAFSRRVEHRILDQLFEDPSLDKLVFDYQQTPRNGPIAAFLEEIGAVAGEQGLVLSRSDFEERCPVLSHTVRRMVRG